MMRVIKCLFVFAAITVCFFAFSAAASAMSFSADVYSSDGHNGKFYMSADKIRIETSEMINIVRLDKKLAWMLMPPQKIYMEQVLNPVAMKQNYVPSSDLPPDEVQKVFILRETVNGYVSDKYKIIINKKDSHYEWISSDPGITMPVKTASLDGKWWHEYRNISLDTPDQSLFEIPAGYTKMSMPGMGNFMPQ